MMFQSPDACGLGDARCQCDLCRVSSKFLYSDLSANVWTLTANVPISANDDRRVYEQCPKLQSLLQRSQVTQTLNPKPSIPNPKPLNRRRLCHSSPMHRSRIVPAMSCRLLAIEAWRSSGGSLGFGFYGLGFRPHVPVLLLRAPF